MTARPFRFGVSIQTAATRAEWSEKARRAESFGFDTVLVADHLVDNMLSPFTALLAAADATERLRVGTLVLNNDFRHPALVAREAAVVDLLSDGRFELGLGAGHMKFEYDEVGLQFDPPSVRVERMTESAEVIRRLLDGETVTFDERHYHLTEHRCFPVPPRHVPLLIGGNGRRVLTAAARLADIVGFTGFSQVEGNTAGQVNPTHFTEAGLRQQIDWVLAAAPERFDGIELSTLVQGITITDDRRAAAEDVQPLLPMLTVDEILSSPYSLIGTYEEIATQLRDRRDQLGISYVTVFEKDLEPMARLIELLS
jgi:probable F420-dependent oxidoreductase